MKFNREDEEEYAQMHSNWVIKGQAEDAEQYN